MQTFQTAAVVGLIDNMSGPLKELAAKAKAAAKQIEAMKIDSSGAQALTGHLNNATSAAERHLTVVRKIHEAWKGVGGIVAGLAAAKLTHMGVDAVKRYAPLESETRFQRAIGNYSDSDMRLLDRQRQDAARTYGSTLLDTTKAQQVFTARMFSAPITEAATNASLALGRAMNVGAAEAGKMIESSIFAQGMHLDSPGQARAETMRAADMAAIAAKKGAMSPEDIEQLNIYGMAPAHAAGLSPEQVYATGMTFKRANIDGTQAGTFMRAAASRLIAPTTMGRDALALMLARQGKSLNDFTGGVSLSPEAIDEALRQNGRGRGLGEKGIASLRASMDDEEKNVIGDRGSFNEALRKAFEDSGQTFDKGEIPKLVAHGQRLRDIALQKTNASGLYDNILQNATQGEKIKIFGDKQGGRAGSLIYQQYDEYRKAQEQGSGYAQKIAEERMQGLAAALGRLETSFDTFGNRMAEANEKWLTPLLSGTAKFIDSISNMSNTAKEFVTAGMAITTLAAAAKGASFALGLLGGGKAVAGLAEGGVAGAVAKNLGKGALLTGGGITGTGLLTAAGLAALGVWGISEIPDGTGGRKRGYGRGASMHDGYKTEADYWNSIDLPQRSSFWHTDSGPNQKMLAASRRELMNSVTGSGDPSDFNTMARSASVKIGEAKDGDAKWGDPHKTAIEVTGTVTGSAEVHQNIAVEIRPSTYFEGLVKRAESVANMSLNGNLGTGLQGPGDNSVKASQAAPTGGQ